MPLLLGLTILGHLNILTIVENMVFAFRGTSGKSLETFIACGNFVADNEHH